MNWLKSAICFFAGHRPNKPTGFYCTRCEKFWFQW